MRKSFQRDENFGKKYEDLLLEYFNGNPEIHGDIEKTKNKYNVVDFVNDEWTCELKSRRYSINSFASFMVGQNKMEEAEKEYQKDNHKTFRFYFILKEGVYFWDFEPNPNNDDDDMLYYYSMGGRNDRGKDERKMTAYIFSENLNLLTDSIHS
tara:strand:- start:449 stop:907 length:459 start_codon:yes stop_codon:yes gene_type:complete